MSSTASDQSIAVTTASNGTLNDLEKRKMELVVEKPPRLTNYGETLMHILKSNVGSGLFAMGYAFQHAGLLLGPILVVVIGVICVFCQHMMLDVCSATSKRLNKKEDIGFEEASKLCFVQGHPKMTKWGPHIGRSVRTFVCITQSGFCSVYIVFISTNMKQIWDTYLSPINIHAMMAIIIVPFILLSWVRDLKSLAPFSILANVLIISAIFVIIVEAAPGLSDISDRRLVSPIGMLPIFFGTVLYTFEGIALVTPVKAKSRNPEKFANLFGPLNVGMFLLGALIILVGEFGYLRWGDDVEGSITLNLDEDSISGQVVKVAVSVGVLLTYPIQLYPVIINISPIYERLCGPFKRPVVADIILRSLYGLFLFALAELVPQLGLFISLVGAVSSTALALIFPPLMHSVTFYEDYGRFSYQLWRNVLIILFGFLGFATGTYISLRDIIIEFSSS